MKLWIYFSVLWLLISSNAIADDLVDKFDSWSLIETEQDGQKICYLTSSPASSSGNYKKRSEAYVLVTNRGDGIMEVSVSSGYNYKEKSTVTIDIDKKYEHEFFTTNETPRTAWAKDHDEDQKVIEEMIKGNMITVRGTSTKGTKSKDAYSLKSFGKAAEKLKNQCYK